MILIIGHLINNIIINFLFCSNLVAVHLQCPSIVVRLQTTQFYSKHVHPYTHILLIIDIKLIKYTLYDINIYTSVEDTYMYLL